MGDSMPNRISGYDLFANLLKWGNHYRKSIYLLGSHTSVIKDLIEIIHDRYPNLEITGYHNGYFKSSKSIAKEIQQKHPDMVFIALGYPKQEEFIHKYQTLNNGLWMGVGGSFDVLSGHTKRAPQFWITHHIEWLYRLIKEPRRLGRMMALPRFLIDVYKQKMTESK
ncbi:MAG: glycosyltransferase [Acetilactobacillus jinshanensis]